MNCNDCGKTMSPEEFDCPNVNPHGESVCDGCWFDNYHFECGLCCEHSPVESQHTWLIVFDDEEAGIERGIYHVNKCPYYCQPTIGRGMLYKSALKRVADVPNGNRECPNGYACGHACDACAEKLGLTQVDSIAAK